MKVLKSQPLLASPMQSLLLAPYFRGDEYPPYIQQLRWTFRDKLDDTLFWKAWRLVLKRHDTFFHHFKQDQDEKLFVLKKKHLQVDFFKEDWRRLSELKQKEKLKEFLKMDLRNAFDRKQSRLCRFTLIRLNSSHSEVIWTSHHALFDGRGRLQLLGEFFAAYQHLRMGESPAPGKATPYENYLKWCGKQDWKAGLGFWKQSLKDLKHTTPLNFGFDKKPLNGKPGQVLINRLLDKELTGKLHAFSERQGISLNILTQAAWGLLLARTSGEDIVAFGAPRACRKSHIPNTDSMVGVTVNTIPVVVRVEKQDTVESYLNRIKDNWSAIRPHENTPLTKILAQWNPGNTDPLFKSLAGYEKYQLNQIIGSQYPARHTFSLVGHTDIPLTLQLKDGVQLRVEISYQAHLFSKQTILQVVSWFTHLLRQLTGSTSRKLADIELLDKAEKQRLLRLGKGRRPAIDQAPVHRIFEKQVIRNPTGIALRFAGRSTSYACLNEGANRLARFLKRHGVKQGQMVGLFLQRGEMEITAQLAVLKAGAAYVPLDTGSPGARLRQLVRKAKPQVILASRLLERQAKEAGLDCLLLEESSSDSLKRFSAENLKVEVDWNQPAYLMYTSGSTGEPKGVVVPHRGIARLVQKQSFVPLHSRTRCLQMAPLTFDASTFEIWAPLLNGGSCVLFPDRVPSIQRLGQVLKTERINTLWLTSALFNYIIDTAPHILKRVKHLLAGGEALSPAHVKKALRILTDTQLINGYGPTENTTFSCCHPIPRNHREMLPIPLGHAINHSTAFVLDAEKRLQPTGVPGELYVGGLGVALGYYRETNETEMRFITTASLATIDIPLYKTGDRVYQRKDGLFEYLGRFDDQVKIRGFRVEPGEIQNQLNLCQGVKTNVVLVDSNNRDEKELVAYVVSKQGSSPSKAALLRELSKTLPEYMLPSRILFTESLPLTQNGKIDKKALLKDAHTRPSGKPVNDWTPNNTETKLAEIWKDVLGKYPASPQEDFFEAGGHSLLATEFSYRFQKRFNTELPFTVFQNHATIASISRWIGENKPSTQNEVPKNPFKILPIKTKPIEDLSIKWRNYYLKDIADPENAVSLTICRAILMEGRLKPRLLKQAMEAVINNHERFKTHAIAIKGSYFEKIEDHVSLSTFPICPPRRPCLRPGKFSRKNP
jgi:surfactin family lipopeptide synthetase C